MFKCPGEKWTGDSEQSQFFSLSQSESPVHFFLGHKFFTEIEILSDQAESWPGPQSRLHMSWGCELGYFGLGHL